MFPIHQIGTALLTLALSVPVLRGQSTSPADCPAADQSRQARLKWAMAGPPKSFHIGVYVETGGTKNPIQKMFRDFAERSIDLIWVNFNYFNAMQPKGLLSYAKSHGVSLVIQCFITAADVKVENGKTVIIAEDRLRNQVRQLKQILDRDPAGDAVIGYAMNDEIEFTWKPSDFPNAEQVFQHYARLIRQEDPNRLVNMNHSPRHGDTSQLFLYASGEDWPWCSIYATTGANRGHILKIRDMARQHGFPNYIAVGQTLQGTRTFKDADLRWHGFPDDVSSKDYADYPVTRQIEDTFFWTYQQGLSGLVYFVYDPGRNASYIGDGMVNDDGTDKDGKWTAFLAGAQTVRRLQGWPEITRVVRNGRDLTITASGQWGGHRIKWIEVQSSNDQGKTWSTRSKIRDRSGTIALPPDVTSPVRIRAWDGHRFSRWWFQDL